MNKKKCTAVTMGTIVERRDLGFERPIVIKVQYVVDGKTYAINDTLKYRREAIKLGFLPIGQRKVPKLENNQVDTSVRVAYNPEHPDMAYLPDNKGIMNA